jgi:hypothetical protein
MYGAEGETFIRCFRSGPEVLVASGMVNGTFVRAKVGVYAAEVPLQSGKTIASIALPNDGNMHIFALGIS